MAKRWTEKLRTQVLTTIFGDLPPTAEEVERLRYQISCHRMFLVAQEEDKKHKDKKAIKIKLGPRYD